MDAPPAASTGLPAGAGSTVQAARLGDTPVATHPHEHIHFQQPDTPFMDQFDPETRTMYMDTCYPDGAHVGYLVPTRKDGRCAARLACILLTLNCSYFVEHLLSSEELTEDSKKVYYSQSRNGEVHAFNLDFLPFERLLERCRAQLAGYRARCPALAGLPASAVTFAVLAQNMGGDSDMDTPRSGLAELGELAQWTDARFP